MPFPMSQDGQITRFYDYWDSLRVQGEVPSKKAFDPVEVGPLLRTIWMVRWDAGAGDFVYRLAGESILGNFPSPIRYKPLAKIYAPDTADEIRARYKRVCVTPAAFFARGQVYRHIDRFGTGERIILPLTDCNGRPSIVIGCTVYSTTGWPKPHPVADAAAQTDLSVFTTLDGAPLERVREAG